jgi:hypothetical protein
MTLPPNFNIPIDLFDREMNNLDNEELAEILQIAQDGKKKLREMSDRATVMAEKWRIKTQAPDRSVTNPESKISS